MERIKTQGLLLKVPGHCFWLKGTLTPYLSIYLPIYPPLYLPTYLLAYVPTYLPILPTYLSTYLHPAYELFTFITDK